MQGLHTGVSTSPLLSCAKPVWGAVCTNMHLEMHIAHLKKVKDKALADDGAEAKGTAMSIAGGLRGLDTGRCFNLWAVPLFPYTLSA